MCWDATNERWGLSRHRDIVAIEKDPVTFTSGVTPAFVPGAFDRGLPVACTPEAASP